MGTTCHICDARHRTVHRALEMMFGTRTEFEYGACPVCGSLQLLNPPSDLAPYYPDTYYSMGTSRSNRFVRLGKRLRAEAAVRGWSRLARVIAFGHRPPWWSQWLDESHADRHSAILDVGSGSGDVLVNLKAQGFQDLTGADPFIPRTFVREGITIHKAAVDDVPGRYDVVMLNHSFEHMPNPHGTLMSLRRLVRDGGSVVLRVPVAGSFAWRRYGTSWVGLDPPRHFYIFTPAAIRRLADRTGFSVVHVTYDSTALQFWGSEQYLRGIPLMAPDSHAVSPSRSPFRHSQIRTWERAADRLNDREDGDQAAFVLRLRG